MYSVWQRYETAPVRLDVASIGSLFSFSHGSEVKRLSLPHMSQTSYSI